MNILSFDVGTSSVKLAVLDENTKILESVTVGYQYAVSNNDWVELDPDEVFNAIVKGIRKLSVYHNDIGLVGFDTFSPSVVFMDMDGAAVHPIITHLDRRSKKQTRDILETMGKEKFQSITGVQPFTGGVSITTILWMKENNPEIYNSACKIGHLPTYIYKKLTGCWAIDPVNASMMGLYETTEWGNWSEEILNTFDISREKLPEIFNAGEILGVLNKEISDLTGLPEGIPVALGSNDAAVAQIGAGNREEGDILNISGSSEMISVISEKPVISDSYYLRNSVIPGKWQIFAITVGGFAVDWFREEFYKDMDKEAFFKSEVPDVIDNYVLGRSIEFLPYLAGDRQCLTPKKASFNGMTLETTRKDLLGSIFLGIHEPVIDTIELTKKFMTHNRSIKLTGGMTTGSFIDLKKKLFPGFEFIVRDNCPIIGNGILALDSLKSYQR